MTTIAPRIRIGRLLDPSGLGFVGNLDEIRVTVGAGRNLTLTQTAPWPNVGENDTDTTDNGWVDITGARDGYPSVTKRFSLSKARMGLAGATGSHTAQILIYQRSPVAPILPTVATTYTFATSTLDGLNNGWTTAIPSGTDTLWVSAASAVGTDATEVVHPNEWAPAIVYSANGLNTATIFLFKRGTTPTVPATPSQTTTYTFSTGALSGVLDGWTQGVPPAIQGGYLFVTTATALATNPTDPILPSEWDAAELMSQDGTAGARGPVRIQVATTGTTWSDAQAVAGIAAAGYGVPQSRDLVTLYNSAAGYSESRFWDPAGVWTVVTEFLNGNLFVTGSIAGDRLIVDSVDASKIKVGTITTDRLIVGAATSAATSASVGATQTGILGTVIDTGVTPVVSLTCTGAPVTVWGKGHVMIASGNTGDGSGNGDSRSYVITLQLFIDGVHKPESDATFSCWSSNLSGLPGPRAEITMPIIWRGTLPAGSHVFSMQTEWYSVSTNGAQVAQANGGATQQIDYYLTAQENKV